MGSDLFFRENVPRFEKQGKRMNNKIVMIILGVFLSCYSLCNAEQTAEEILQKVADNYALIKDFKADMTFSSTLDGKPFGETEYCKYYFKAPKKEKTETYSDSNMTTKKEIIIIDSSMIYLIDPINKTTQKTDLAAQANVTGAQFNQMDIYYNLSNFLNNHIITRDDAKTDLNNMIVVFDAIPKEPNSLYAKLELYIDYQKGLLLKSSLYRKDKNNEIKLIQTTETVETQQMPNGAWLPKKMKKIPVLTSGNFISTVVYSNPQVNIGLTDDLDFNPEKQY